MRLFANILWHFPGFGFVSATLTYLLGILLMLTIVGAPIGRGLMALGTMLYWPFGRVIVDRAELGLESEGVLKWYSTALWIVYLPFGVMLTFMGIMQIVVLFFSFFGIPLGIVVAKSLSTYFKPMGKVCISKAEFDELERRRGAADLDARMGQGKGSPVGVELDRKADVVGLVTMAPQSKHGEPGGVSLGWAKLKDQPKVLAGGAVVVAILLVLGLKGPAKPQGATEVAEPVKAAQPVPKVVREAERVSFPALEDKPVVVEEVKKVPPPEALADKVVDVAPKKPESVKVAAKVKKDDSADKVDKAKLKATSDELDRLLKN